MDINNFKHKKKGIYQYGFVYPPEEKVIKFLNKIYNTSFDSTKSWEEEIYKFFRENPVVIYYIERCLEDDFEELLSNFRTEFEQINKGMYCWSSEVVFKELVKIKQSIDLDSKRLKNYADFFLINSIILRRMFCKRTDSDDSAFKEFKTGMYPCSFEAKNNEDIVTFYEHVFLFYSDASIDYSFDSIVQDIRNDFQNAFDAASKEKKAISKRSPLDSKLRHECFKRDNYTCKECGVTKKDRILHCDHIIPVSQGGADELDNLQTLCDECNLAKSNKKWKAGEINEVKNEEIKKT